GPPGAGKTTLLQRTARALEGAGWATVYLDLMGAASSPERFVSGALQALPADRFGSLLARATDLRRALASGRAGASGAVQSLFELWTTLDQAAGGRVALLLDEPTEIRSLSYFAGLREVHAAMGSALAARPRGTVLATCFPTLARRLWPTFELVEMGPVTAEELETAWRGDGRERVAALARAAFGWPRYLRILAARVSGGDDLEAAWAEEMAPGGALDGACRHTYESLLLRSRGYGMSKAVLATVAAEEGLNLTALVKRLGRTPGAVRDYVGWLLAVDALRSVRKRYYYVDGLLRWWVWLHARGTPPEAPELRAAARQAVAPAAENAPGPAAAAAPPAAAPATPPPGARGSDSLMEID
ncbi:MAG TPA: ATP-binding protein, partial [Vicinamibacteria bacterium]|nr:ATP-binding protein [Vicinamibacteria bacterium]